MKLREYKERVKLYLKVVKTICKNSICSQLAYPANLFMAVLIQSSFLAVQLIFIDSIYSQVDSIMGWNKYDLIFYTITATLIDSLFISTSFLNLIDFPALIREGRLDFMMTKPLSCKFLVSIKWIDTGALLQVLQNFCMLTYPLYKLQKMPTLTEIVLYICSVVTGVFVLYCFYLTISCIAFWVVKTDFIDNIYGLAYMLALKPINIYPRIIRLILCSILPLGLIFYVPANTIKSVGFIHLLLLIVIAILYSIFANFIWKLGIKKYSSAG
jgi:ABC-2 type transport system permease protein